MTATKIFHYVSPRTTQEIADSICSKLPIKLLPIQTIQDLFPLLSSPNYYSDFVVIDIVMFYQNMNGVNIFDIINTNIDPDEVPCNPCPPGPPGPKGDKAEMGPPLGNRKVTIVCSGEGTIDGEPSYVMTTPYESVQLFNDGIGSWFVI